MKSVDSGLFYGVHDLQFFGNLKGFFKQAQCGEGFYCLFFLFIICLRQVRSYCTGEGYSCSLHETCLLKITEVLACSQSTF